MISWFSKAVLSINAFEEKRIDCEDREMAEILEVIPSGVGSWVIHPIITLGNDFSFSSIDPTNHSIKFS